MHIQLIACVDFPIALPSESIGTTLPIPKFFFWKGSSPLYTSGEEPFSPSPLYLPAPCRHGYTQQCGFIPAIVACLAFRIPHAPPLVDLLPHLFVWTVVFVPVLTPANLLEFRPWRWHLTEQRRFAKLANFELCQMLAKIRPLSRATFSDAWRHCVNVWESVCGLQMVTIWDSFPKISNYLPPHCLEKNVRPFSNSWSSKQIYGPNPVKRCANLPQHHFRLSTVEVGFQ